MRVSNNALGAVILGLLGLVIVGAGGLVAWSMMLEHGTTCASGGGPASCTPAGGPASPAAIVLGALISLPIIVGGVLVLRSAARFARAPHVR